MGAGWCPPGMLGIGIGGTAEHCVLLAKQALMEPIDMAQLKGDQSVDMLKRNSTSTMGGRPTLINPRATPGRIDMIDTKNFWRLEIKPTDYYEVGGQTLFPLIGNSGGIQSASIFYLVWSGQLGMTNPRLSSYISNAAIPRTYFGR